MIRTLFDKGHESWRASVRGFLEKEVEPHLLDWDQQRAIPASLWTKAAQLGLLGMRVPEEYGGAGITDYRYRYIVMEELARVGASSVNAALSLVDDLVAPYLVDLGTDEQRKRHLPGLCAGTTSTALAMTEPQAGSDLRGIRTSARRTSSGWVLNGSKTFITNGGHADVVLVLARTGKVKGGNGMTFFLVEKGTPGFTAGEPLDTLGRRAESVNELFFSDVEVPADAVLGDEGNAFKHAMERLPTERMAIACYATALSAAAVEWTLDYVRDRELFGKRLVDLQNTRFAMAEMTTEVEMAQAYVDQAVLALNSGRLTAVDAAKAKWWSTELLQRVLTRCLQLHGGYGYTREYPICRAFADGRVQTIFGGSTEVMKEIIGRSIA
jgi:alkylation response protein AidB-like acyl-CoA dehydrogenase